jgi:hypothetical protein
MEPIFERLTPALEARLCRHVKDIQFFESPTALAEYLNRCYPRRRGRRTATAGAYLYRVTEKEGILLLNGTLDDRYTTTATYAHEIGHALDGPPKIVSNRSDWKRAWSMEIKGQGSLSEKARESAYEGFAEFCRYVMTSRLDEITLKSLFPLCYEFWSRLS